MGVEVLNMAMSAVAEPWHHTMESSFGGLQVVPLSGSTTRATGTFASTILGGVGVFGISGTPQQLVRSASTVRRSPTESVKVCAVRRGWCLIEQSGREVPVGPGHFALYDTARPYRITFRGAWECEVMTAPPSSLGVPATALDRALARTWSTATGTGAVLLQFMSTYASMPLPGVAAGNHLASAGASLLAGAILDDLEPVIDEVGDALRRRIELHVEGSLQHPELSLASIAAAHHVSVRTIQRLFAGTGKGLSAHIRQRRLHRVKHDLSAPLLAHLTISEVAARWCIHDAQWLAKAFKAEFGMSPSEFRRSLATDARPADVETALQTHGARRRANPQTVKT